LIAICASAHVALADALPPPGYIEGCTFENAEEAGEECVQLSRWVFDGRCVKALAEQGFCHRCGIGATMRDEIYCRKRGGTALRKDWTKQCLVEPDPRKLAPKDLPRLPKVAQCPTERTASRVVALNGDEGDETRKESQPSGCGCSAVRSEPLGVWSILLLALLLRRR